MNPEFDALIEKYHATVPRQERIQALGEIVPHISDQLNVMGRRSHGPGAQAR
jgi:hypothetical protein